MPGLFQRPPKGLIKADEKPPSSKSVDVYKQGLTQAVSGDPKRALALFQTAEQMDPQNVEATRGRERLEQALGLFQPQEASPEMEQASRALYQTGLKFYMANDPQNAIDSWTKAYNLNQANTEALRGLERIAQRYGKIYMQVQKKTSKSGEK